MLKLLIVDDEVHVREGIVRTIARGNLGDIELLTAASGREGLALAEGERPEIIISDVRMPQMNGLDMARSLLEKLPQVKLIFISAYSEIEYYRTAMKLRAVSFVEKPIIPEELLCEVRRAIELIAIELRASEASLSIAAQEEIAFLSLLHRNAGGVPAEIQEKLRASACLHTYVIGRLRETPSTDRLAAARAAIQRIMAPDPALTLCGIDGSNCVFLLASPTPPGDRMPAISRALLDSFPGQQPFITFAEAHGESDIPKALESAVSQQVYRFYHPQAHFYVCENRSVIRSQPDICTPEFLNALSESIERCQEDRAVQLFREGLQRLRFPAECTPEHVRLTALHLLNTMNSTFARLGVEDMESTSWAEVSRPETFDALMLFSAGLLHSRFSALAKLGESGRCVYLIKHEIEKNYADPDFSIAQLAKRLYLSESYAGNLFKRRTGMTIGSYLNSVRMERAKQLLHDPANKVSEVGQKVGIENTDYFTRRFKQYTGKTPSEYRR
ncbi:MAG: response regulator [Candidatus Faecivicinus sp.]